MTHAWVMSINRYSLGRVTSCYAEDVDDVEDAVCLYGIFHYGKPKVRGATFRAYPTVTWTP